VRVPPNLCKILYEWGLQEELATATRCRKSAFHSSKSLLSCALFSRLCACVPIFATVPRSFAFCILPDFFYPSAWNYFQPLPSDVSGVERAASLLPLPQRSGMISLFGSTVLCDAADDDLQSRLVRSWVI
jgi:hypothetical protein